MAYFRQFVSWARSGDWTALDLPTISGPSWGAFAYLVIVGSLVGFSTFVWLMKKCPPAQVSTFAYVNPVVAVILGWLILGEPITSRTLVATVIVIAAVVIITLEKNKPAPAAPVSLKNKGPRNT